MSEQIQEDEQATPQSGFRKFMAEIVVPAGFILAVSYPVLALSTGTRAVVQLLRLRGEADTHLLLLPPLMSATAALCYLFATIGFAYRRRWTWWLSVALLGIESALTLMIGTWSFIEPDLIGRTVWRHFGEDYGYFPLFQPLIGLLWLFWPDTRRIYGFNGGKADEEAHGGAASL